MAKAKAKAKAVPIKKSELITAVKDMNTVMQMKPALKADDKMKYGELVGVVKKLTGEAFTTDEFKPTTWALIKKLGIEVKEPEEDPGPKEKTEEELPKEEEAPKKTIVKKTVAKPKKTSTVEKSCYGHKLGTMAATVDKMLAKGTTQAAVVKEIIKKFPDKDERLANNKFTVHKAYLTKKFDIVMEYNEKTKVYKADRESI